MSGWVQFIDDDGVAVYHGTYTAYDGDHVAPHLLSTKDFQTYSIASQAGLSDLLATMRRA
jgi:hypothetical protein